ncbi:MAG: ATPase, T2SS/T4P/T4SS family [bacterium]|nr:ATPase, T2SS/T4P/T4SS family [bacterium]
MSKGPLPFQKPPLTLEPSGEMVGYQVESLGQHEGFWPAVSLVYEAINGRADKILLDFTRDSVAVQFQIDGIWHKCPPRDRQSGDALLTVLKQISNCNPNERRARQDGRFGAKVNKTNYASTIMSQGVKTGERVVVTIRERDTAPMKLPDLGIREKVVAKIKELVSLEKGMMIFSAPPDGGLRTTWRGALESADKFTRDFVGCQSASLLEDEVINVDPVLYDESQGKTAADVLPEMIRKEPNVLVVPEIKDAASMEILCKAGTTEQMVLTRVRVKDCAEALLRLRAVGGPPELFAKAIKGVTNQRLVRRLCETCKEAYQPQPQLLQRLGVPPGRVKALYREKKPLTPEQIAQLQEAKQPVPPNCPDCHAVGFRGRAALVQTLEVDDAIRKALVNNAGLAELQQLAKNAGVRSLQEEAILQVVLGVTSLTEAQRVLKAG